MALQSPYDILGDLKNDVVQDGNAEVVPTVSKLEKCLMLIVTVFNFPVSALVDTGSQVTRISEEFHDYLMQHGDILELPVTNCILLTAIGKKPTRIKKQVLLNIRIGTCEKLVTFLVVPGLSNKIIFGNNCLLDDEVILDFKNRKIIVDFYDVPCKLMLYGRPSVRERIINK